MAATNPSQTLASLCTQLGYEDAADFYWLADGGDDLPSQVRDSCSKLGVDAVYGSQRGESGQFKPVVYFSALSNRPQRTAAEIYNKVWNEGLASLLVVVKDGTLKIYNCTREPVDPEGDDLDTSGRLFDTLNLVEESLEESTIGEDFDQLNLASGGFWKANKDAFSNGTRVEQQLLDDLTALKSKLTKDIEHTDANRLIIRSLFILYLEDRDIISTGQYKSLFGAESYLEILEDKEKTYGLFEEVDNRLNGDIFDYDRSERERVTDGQLKWIREFLRGTDLETGQRRLMFPYQFDIIPIELISSIYEHFVGAGGSDGIYYTRPELVEYMYEVHLEDDISEFDSIVDPACGSGVFLVDAFTRIAERKAQPVQNTNPEELKRILTDRLYGFDINPEAVQITTFSLSLKLLEYVEDVNVWEGEFELPSLAGQTIQCQDFFATGEPNSFDLIIGNPPWERVSNLDTVAQSYLDETGYAVSNGDSAQAFMWRAYDSLSEEGNVVFAVPTRKVLLNTQAREFRESFFDTAHVKSVSNLSLLRQTLFENAVAPASVITYGRASEELRPEVRYITPTPTGGEGLRTIPIDEQADVKYLSSEFQQQPFIWKAAMWGGVADFKLLQRLQSKSSIGDTAAEQDWYIGSGFKALSSTSSVEYAPELAALPHLETKSIQSYTVPDQDLVEYSEEPKFTRPRKSELYQPPLITIRKTAKKQSKGPRRSITAAYHTTPVSFRTTLTGISGDSESAAEQKLATVVLNSSLAQYWLFMTSAGWGIERPRMRQSEIRSIPFPIDSLREYESELLAKFDELVDYSKSDNEGGDYQEIISAVDELLYEAYGLSEVEASLVETRVDQTLDYFHNRENSGALDSVDAEYMNTYGEILAEEINWYLEHSERSLYPVVHDLSKSNLPYQLLTLQLSREQPEPVSEDAQRLLRQKLEAVNKDYALFQERVIQIYEDDRVHLIKPDEARHWSRAQAANDAPELVGELLLNA